jgi:hypothetical protein
MKCMLMANGLARIVGSFAIAKRPAFHFIIHSHLILVEGARGNPERPEEGKAWFFDRKTRVSDLSARGCPVSITSLDSY